MRIVTNAKAHDAGNAASLEKQPLILSAFWTLLSHVLSRGSLMCSAVILARSLSVSDFAAYSYFQLSISLFATYASLGLGVAASKYFAQLKVANSNSTPPIAMLWMMSLALAVLAATAVLFAPASALNSDGAIPRWLFALGVFVLALQIVPSGAIMGLEKYQTAANVSVFSGIFLLAGALTAASYDAPLIAVWTLILGSIIQVMGEGLIVYRSVPFTMWRLRAKDLKSQFKQIIGLAGPMLCVSILAASGTWIIGHQLLRGKDGTSEFAMYSIGLQWFSLVLLLPGMLSRVLLPRIIRARNVSAVEVRKLTRQALFLAACSSIAVAGTVAALAKHVVNLYGDAYAGNSWTLICFLIAGVFGTAVNTLGNAIVASNRQKLWLALTAVWFLVLIITAHAFQDRGAIAGALALGCAAFVHTCLTFVAARRLKIL